MTTTIPTPRTANPNRIVATSTIREVTCGGTDRPTARVSIAESADGKRWVMIRLGQPETERQAAAALTMRLTRASAASLIAGLTDALGLAFDEEGER